MKISKIYEGWKNALNPPEYLKEIINKTQEERLSICRNCPKHSSNHYTPLRPDEHCTDCGCTLSAKTACLSCECPLDSPLWKAVMTKKEQEKIKNE